MKPHGARYMLDANAFDHIVDHGIDPRSVKRLGDIFITDVQHGELLDVPDPRRREALLAALSGVDPIVRPAFSVTASSEGRPGTPRKHVRAAVEGAPAGATPRAGRTARGHRRWKDVAIGDVAELEGCVLVTNDKAFGQRAAEAGVAVMSCAEAFADLES